MSKLDRYIYAVFYMEYVTVNALIESGGDKSLAAALVERHVTERCLELGIDVDVVLLHASASVVPVLN